MSEREREREREIVQHEVLTVGRGELSSFEVFHVLGRILFRPIRAAEHQVEYMYIRFDVLVHQYIAATRAFADQIKGDR